VAAASSGRRVLVVDVEGKSGLSAAFGANPLGYEPTLLDERVAARIVTPDQALLEFLDDHNLHWLAKRLQSMNLVDVIATAAPGLKDILVLGKVKQLERRGEFDLILVDAPAAGHTLTFLGSAAGVLDAVRVGPVRVQAEEVQEMLVDNTRTRVVLVTLPEETPVNETIETADALVDLQIEPAGVLVNGWYPYCDEVATDEVLRLAEEAGTVVPRDEATALSAASEFSGMRHRLQQAQLGRIEDLLALPIVRLPFLFTAEIGRREIGSLADALMIGLRDAESAQEHPA